MKKTDKTFALFSAMLLLAIVYQFSFGSAVYLDSVSAFERSSRSSSLNYEQSTKSTQSTDDEESTKSTEDEQSTKSTQSTDDEESTKSTQSTDGGDDSENSGQISRMRALLRKFFRFFGFEF